MAFQTPPSDDDSALMGEINMIPLIDVMLVLLIVFMVTIPVLTHAVQVQLPQASAAPLGAPPEAIRLSLAADGQLYWNKRSVAPEELAPLLRQASAQQPQPQLHLHADQAVRYEHVARALAAAQRAGIAQIAFATRP